MFATTDPSASPAARPGVAACPKSMVHGPCGGVLADGGCETGDRPCAFAGPDRAQPSHVAPASRARLSAAVRALVDVLDRRPLVVAELPSSGPDPDELRRVAAALAGSLDAALLGDAPWARVQLPPTVRALLAAQRPTPFLAPAVAPGLLTNTPNPSGPAIPPTRRDDAESTPR